VTPAPFAAFDANAAPTASPRSSAPDTDRFEIVADPAALEALRPEWDALYERAAQPYFSQSFSWCWTSWQTVSRPRGRRLHCVIARRGSRIVLIWPFVIHRLGAWSVVRPLGPETSEYSDVLVEEGAQAAARIAAAWKILRRTCQCDIITLPLVRSGSGLHLILSEEVAPAFVETDPTSYVRWANYKDWQDYERSLGSETRRVIRRRRRRLQEKGELIFEPVVEPAQSSAVIDWVLREKKDRLARTNLRNHWMHTPEYRAFLMKMAATPQPASGILIAVLRLSGQIIAAQVHRVDRVRVEGLIPVFDPAFAAYGLGQILQEECLKWAFTQGRDYDLRLGKQPHKEIWVNGSCDVISYEFGNSRWGRFYVLYRNAAQGLSRLRYWVPPEWRRKIKAALGRGAQRH